ncbi:helix-turn-helix domain-containing protein [Streptomyces bobili]|uniref:helix-turn-helix domain-containing protein n=1 Tax=Streptomyces bobili TaxID=67280 RepID=UPI003655F590
MKVRADIAAMLRAGTSDRQIKAELHVDQATITATRRALRIDPVRPAPLTQLGLDARRATAQAREARIVAMLRAGATIPQIRADTGCSRHTIARVRRAHGLPSPPPVRPRTSIAEALACYVQPYGDDHARWTGPTSKNRDIGQPQLYAEGRRYNARHEIFRAHHGRAPEGRVRTTCTEPRCIAGPHLADDIHRQAEEHLDDLVAAIFGPDTAHQPREPR